MPTPEQQQEYTRLSGLIRQICMRYMRELPQGTTSVLLTNKDRKVRVEACDKMGKVIGTVPNEKTSAAFATDLTRVFASVVPDPDGIIAIVSNPITVSTQR